MWARRVGPAAGQAEAPMGSVPLSPLRARAEFLRVQQSRHKWRGAHLLLAVCYDAQAPRPDPTRLGLTVSRKVGTAVVRNRIKRRLRAAWQQGVGALAGAGDFVVIAFASAAQARGPVLAEELSWLIRRAERHRPSPSR